MIKIQKLDFLISLYIFCILASETLGAKTFSLYSNGSFHLNASVAIFVVPIVFTVNDVIIEVYGAERARSIARSGLAMIVLLFLFSWLGTSLPPSTRYLSTENSYDTIFGTSMRFSFASLAAFAFSDFLDIFIFHRLRKAFGKKNLWFRNNASNFISQFIDTITFMVLAFYSTSQGFGPNVAFIWSLALPYWLLRCAMSVVETPFVYLGTAWLKRDVREA